VARPGEKVHVNLLIFSHRLIMKGGVEVRHAIEGKPGGTTLPYEVQNSFLECDRVESPE
jgi:hypothetical protein